ncbi:YesL family protein [Streptococcus pyogenes]|uniref:YesL family protein n=1 Tax=Streptococcus pyogenes TaxID=1314 RepID=UPI000DA3210B|nr:YesL family protein [Streptococcus pyogenes]SQE55001.1 membrane protein [Streptococcus pyogenes]SQE89817.1 membrane protein [Streptococcus pyogenes]SQF17041.1 membrane protein [Streptococcus pyogenes]SQF37226.1 membrane protein [Streptococcus pyogenes]HER2959324.1 YesL family protein [Streptococcus pyogenes]
MTSKKQGLLHSLFKLDSKWMRASAALFDLLVFNLLFVLSCLPLLTIGVAKMALYASLLDWREGQVSQLVTTYSSHFKHYFKRGMRLGLIELLIMSICVLDLFLIRNQSGIVFQGFKVLCIAVLFLVVILFLYAYPQAVRKELPLLILFKRSLLLAGIFFPWTFAFLVVIGLLVFTLPLTLLTLFYSLSLLATMGISSLTYLYLIIMESLLRRFPLNNDIE